MPCVRIVYRKFLLLYKDFFDAFNRLSTLIFCVRIVYRKILLLYKNFRHVFYKLSALMLCILIVYCKLLLCFTLNCPCLCSGSVLYIANCYCYIKFLLCFSLNRPRSCLVSALYTAKYYCYIIIFLMYLKELPVLMFWFCIVYCKMLLLYKNFSHVSKETAHVFVIYTCHILNIAVTKNCSLFWLLLHFKLPVLCSGSILYTVKCCCYNKVPSCSAKLFRWQMHCKPTKC